MHHMLGLVPNGQTGIVHGDEPGGLRLEKMTDAEVAEADRAEVRTHIEKELADCLLLGNATLGLLDPAALHSPSIDWARLKMLEGLNRKREKSLGITTAMTPYGHQPASPAAETVDFADVDQGPGAVRCRTATACVELSGRQNGKRLRAALERALLDSVLTPLLERMEERP